MRHHRFSGWADAPPPQPRPHGSPPGAGRRLGSPDGPAAQAEREAPAEGDVRELRELIGWLRQRLRGEHVVRACVLTVEPAGPDSHLILLGEAEASGSHDPPRLRTRLDATELDRIRAEHGREFEPESLVNRTVTLCLRTGLRQRFGRGAGVQGKVMRLLALGELPIEVDLERERALQRLRLEGRRFGPDTWLEPEDLYHVALVSSEHGDARRDVEHVLQPLEEAGLIRIHRISARFEGPGAERSLVEAFALVTILYREHGLAATLVCRGGGPVAAFRPLNAPAVAGAATAELVPNLITGLGHAGTPRTALDAVAARCEPTPTAAAMVVRHLVERTGIRAERALADLDAAIEEDLEAAARIALARVAADFDAALRDLADRADKRLRQLNGAVELSLLGSLAAVTGATARCNPEVGPADLDASTEAASEAILAEALTLVIAAETGRVVTTAEQARADAHLLLQFPDAAVSVRVEPVPASTH